MSYKNNFNILDLSTIKPIEKYIESYCTKSLIESTKQNFETNLENFLNSDDSYFWFLLVDIKAKNDFYNLISKKIGEKFRKIIVKNTHKESYQAFINYKVKFDKSYLKYLNFFLY